jgi:hypothetical protein
VSGTSFRSNFADGPFGVLLVTKTYLLDSAADATYTAAVSGTLPNRGHEWGTHAE